ncbi:hypothetical protein [Micromonospora sp. CA-246542]|uniref:hypothetical protein n=1 Tax=Micromonospora sp. CA-246542 TaxID=3239959 RepID=UPI003D8A6A64
MTAPPLAPWADQLSCYTAALGSWLAIRRPDWWRPLLAGGPVLRVTPVPGDLLRFDHHTRPPAPTLGLRLRTAADWNTARHLIADEASRQRAVIVAGDTFRLPWQRTYGTAHAPHWFLLRPDVGGRWTVEDPLRMMTTSGRQEPVLVEVEERDLAGICRALPAGNPVAELREQAALGVTDVRLGSAYRWLTYDADGTSEVPQTPVAGSDAGAALRLLARMFREHGAQATAYRQADDLWQASRQRELAARMLGGRWTGIAEIWRRLPPLLLHGRLAAEHTAGLRAPGHLADVLEQLAQAEATTEPDIRGGVVHALT